MDFSSDTSAPAHPRILEALLAANSGMAPSYGADQFSARAVSLLRDIFETDLEAYLVSSGTAANALALSLLCPPHGAVICHREAHIERDERGAPEFFTGGAKLELLGGDHAKIAPDELRAALAHRNPSFVHETPSMALSITNLTESGTAYSVDQVRELTGLAKASGLAVHMDGARFGNAICSTGASPADLTWKSGVDVLTFGATKGGALGCEAIILFGDMRAKFAELQARAKRAGHMPAKMRFMSAQMCAFLENGLWLELAGQANFAAVRLADILTRRPDVTLEHPVEGNEVFANLPDELFKSLQNAGLKAYHWLNGSVRFVCNWSTSDEQIEEIRQNYAHFG